MPARTSGVNALAHAVEALWAPGASPMTDALAGEAIRLLAPALRQVAASPGDLDAREAALAGAVPRRHNAFKVELAKRTLVRALQTVTAVA